jgi:hypothetical protein
MMKSDNFFRFPVLLSPYHSTITNAVHSVPLYNKESSRWNDYRFVGFTDIALKYTLIWNLGTYSPIEFTEVSVQHLLNNELMLSKYLLEELRLLGCYAVWVL